MSANRAGRQAGVSGAEKPGGPTIRWDMHPQRERNVERLIRTVRGAIGVGATWAALWAIFGFLFGILLRIVRPHGFNPGENELVISIVFGVVGFLSGVAFSLVMAIAERRRTLDQLSVARAAGWGAIASAALPLLTSIPNGTIVIFAPLGALFAATSVALAKRDARRELAAGRGGLFDQLE